LENEKGGCMSRTQLIIDGVTVYDNGTVTPPDPPPVTPPAGTYGAIWQGAVSLDKEVSPGKQIYGFMNPILAGGNLVYNLQSGINWFRIDPTVNSKTGYLICTVRDETQSHGPVVTMLPIDDKNELVPKTLGFKGVWPYQMMMPYGQGTSPNLSSVYRWLVKVETGLAYPTSIWYK
jgi:hypothetical protein